MKDETNSNTNRMSNEDIIKKDETNSNTIRISLWNIRSLNDFSKKCLLNQILIENNIQVMLLQETFLREKDKIFIQGYKTYKSSMPNISRKGVAILVSKELDIQTYQIRNDPNGRYITIKCKDIRTDQFFTISSVYLEPTCTEQINELIPIEVLNSDLFGGDLNKAATKFTITENVMHHYNLGKLVQTIKTPNSISDHPILIFERQMNIRKINTIIQTQILDKKALLYNQQQIINAINNKIPMNLKNPIKIINKSMFHEQYERTNFEEYQQIKQKANEKFKERMNQEKKELELLLKARKLDEEAWIKLSSLMRTNKQSQFWTTKSEDKKDEYHFLFLFII